ncbi:MAG: universal stress protein [Pyrinomonadaceae bacterium]|jgi:nucleotide-binding universal stress UspA family protein
MKILIATDGARQSEAAIEMLKRFRLEPTDQIKIVSVVDMAVPMAVDIYGGYMPNTAEIEQSARENAERILSDAASAIRKHYDTTELHIITEVLFGSPESRIVEAARDFKADLVVVGSHGYSTWERLLLGSVSDAVVHHVPCSVLVVRICEDA